MTDTANMTAILTDRAKHGNVNSLIGARGAGYRFCATKINMRMALKTYPNLLREDLFVIDPLDGTPGFKYRSLALDHLDVALANKNTSYCHAAIINTEDLEVLQGVGQHCNKSMVGSSVAVVEIGFPISERYSANLKALFSQLMNRNVLSSHYKIERPKRSCSAVDPQIRLGESSFSIEQLAGLWFVTFGFAFVGLIVNCFTPCLP